MSLGNYWASQVVVARTFNHSEGRSKRISVGLRPARAVIQRNSVSKKKKKIQEKRPIGQRAVVQAFKAQHLGGRDSWISV